MTVTIGRISRRNAAGERVLCSRRTWIPSARPLLIGSDMVFRRRDRDATGLMFRGKPTALLMAGLEDAFGW